MVGRVRTGRAAHDDQRVDGRALRGRSRARTRLPDSNEGVTFSANSLADAPWGGTTIMRPVLTVLMVVVLVVLAATCTQRLAAPARASGGAQA